MSKVRLTLLAASLSVAAWTIPHPSSASLTCEILCWTQGNQTCSQASSCKVTCCVTGSRGCFSLCDA